MAGTDLIWVQLIDGNVGNHRIIFAGESYGYRSSGEYFKMRADHAKLDNRVRQATAAEVQQATGEAVTVAPLSTHQLIDVPAAPKRSLPEDNDDDELTSTQTATEGDEDEAVDAEASRLGLRVENSARLVTPEEGKPTTLAPEPGVTILQPKAVYDFTQLWGIGAERQAALLNAGVRSLTGLIAQDVPGIQKLLGVPVKTAQGILKSAQQEAAKQ